MVPSDQQTHGLRQVYNKEFSHSYDLGLRSPVILETFTQNALPLS